MEIYVLKTCDTCRKALKELDAAGRSFRAFDVRSDGVPTEVLQAAAEALGEQLLNKRSTTWRGLDEAERAGNMLDLLAEHPTLMKRPLILDQGRILVGWDKATRAAIGL